MPGARTPAPKQGSSAPISLQKPSQYAHPARRCLTEPGPRSIFSATPCRGGGANIRSLSSIHTWCSGAKTNLENGKRCTNMDTSPGKFFWKDRKFSSSHGIGMPHLISVPHGRVIGAVTVQVPHRRRILLPPPFQLPRTAHSILIFTPSSVTSVFASLEITCFYEPISWLECLLTVAHARLSPRCVCESVDHLP